MRPSCTGSNRVRERLGVRLGVKVGVRLGVRVGTAARREVL